MRDEISDGRALVTCARGLPQNWKHAGTQMGGVVIAEHGQLHHRLVVDECELQLTQLDAHLANGAEAEDEQDERDQGVGHDERFALQVLGLAIKEERGGHVRELELHERSELDAAGCLVSVGREADVEHQECQSNGGCKPELHDGVGADEEDHRGEQELAREVDGLPVVVLVLVGVREQRDARALHPLGRGVLARRLAHLVGEGLGLELGVELE